MRQGRRALAGVVLLLGAPVAGGFAQTGYQAERLEPDPVLKTPATLESMLMRAGYEQRHQDCLDAGFHIDAVLKAEAAWPGAMAMRLFCERSENRRVDEANDLTTMIRLQPKNWRWWSDRALVHEKDFDRKAALVDLNQAIVLRPWDADLYVRRSLVEEDLHDYVSAFADLVKVHELLPEQAGPLLQMAARVVLYGGTEAEAARVRKLAEFAAPKPEDSPRDDSKVATNGMSWEEAMLRAGYAKGLGKAALQLRFLNAALDTKPGLARALEMRVELALMQPGLVAANSYVPPPRLPAPRVARPAKVVRNRVRVADVMCGDQGSGSLEDVERLICIDPKRPDYYRLRIRVLSLVGQAAWDQMMSDYGKVIELEPYEGANYSARGQFELDGGGSADEDFHSALDLDPGNAYYSYQLSQAYKVQRIISAEIVSLNLALVGEPENDLWLRERARLP